MLHEIMNLTGKSSIHMTQKVFNIFASKITELSLTQALASTDSRACIIYAHGGGAIAGSATMHKGLLSHTAVNCGVVVFNVDYRLAPGTR